MAAVFSLTFRLFKALHLMVIVFLWLLLCGFLADKMKEPARMIKALPAALETDGVEWIDGDRGIFDSCGVAVFRLSLASRQRLHEERLSALATALHARGYRDYQYQPWQTTPGRLLADSEGGTALSCGNLPKALKQRIYQGLGRPGGYITGQDDAVLLVLPVEGLVVYGVGGEAQAGGWEANIDGR